MEILAVIPARGGSKTVPGKNIRDLAGRPLIAYSIDAARESRFVTRVVVSTDDERIAHVARTFGADVPFIRPAALAQDDSLDLPVFQHCLDWLEREESYRPALLVHLRPTAPLRTAAHIDQCVELLLSSGDADCVRTVTPAPVHPLKMWSIETGEWLRPFVPASVYGVKEAYNEPRQKLPKAFIQNGSVDVIRPAVILGGSMSGARIKGLVMEELDSINIDSAIDWRLAEMLMLERRAEGSN